MNSHLDHQQSARKFRTTRDTLVRNAWLACLAAIASGVAGCGTVTGEDQWLVSKANMQFSRQPVYSYSSKILPQIQSGLAISGGAQPSTCTVCR